MLSLKVKKLFAGWPMAGSWENMFILITSDSDGFQRICLLSRAEIELSKNGFRCIIRSHHSRENLVNGPRATLIAMGEYEVYYIRLLLVETLNEAKSYALVEFSAVAEKTDSLDVPIRSVKFFVTDKLSSLESWDENRAIFDGVVT